MRFFFTYDKQIDRSIPTNLNLNTGDGHGLSIDLGSDRMELLPHRR